MRFQRVLILILIGWYLILILGHYFNQRPLWNDEICVLNSINNLKPAELFTRPLLSNQEFPRLYLWIIQQFSKPFDHSLLSLRIFSMLAMLGAFFVWLNVAGRALSHTWDFILFIGCWCASMPLVYYAAELKPYSMDVLISGLIVLFLIHQDEMKKNHQNYRVILFLFPLLGLLSYPAIFLLLLPLYNLVRDCADEHRLKSGGACRCLPALSCFLFSYILMLGLVCIFDFRVSVSHQLQVYFWHDYFISFHSLKDFLNSFGKGMNNLIARRFAESPRWIKGPSRIFIGLGLGYMFLAFGRQFKKDHFALRSVITIALALFLMQLLLAIGWVYPLGVPRMSLFYSPLLLLMADKRQVRVKDKGKIPSWFFMHRRPLAFWGNQW